MKINIMEDTNLTYDSCKNCDKLEAEICRLEMIWETERGNNNRLKKENERLKALIKLANIKGLLPNESE